MKNLIGEFLYNIEVVKGQSDRTVKLYKKSLEEFDNFIKKDIKDITKEDVNNYVLYLSKSSSSNKTKNLKLIPIRSFLKFCYVEKDIECLFFEKVQLFKQKNTRELNIPSDEELKQFLKISSPVTTIDLVVNLFFCTGLRVSELLSLKVGQVQETFKVVGKGSKDRLVFCSPRIVSIVREYEESKKLTDKLFPFTSSYLSQLFKKRTKDLKLDIHPHTLRHCFASTLLKNGVGLKEVQDLLGHSSIMTTQIYLHVSNTKLQSSHSKVFNSMV